MTVALSIIEVLLLVVPILTLSYLALLSVLALAQRPRKLMAIARHRRMAFVVPAHNEVAGIAQTVRSLVAVRYPRVLFDVLVVADNCTDTTAARAREAGARVHERHDENLRGKGHALGWLFHRMLETRSDYDAFVVIDADSTVSEDFLEVMNRYLENGALVIQAADLVSEGSTGWSSGVTGIGFFLYNFVRPLGRRVLGGSAGLRGNGMCFSTDALTKAPWRAYSQTEDLEYSIGLLLKGFRVVFAPEASVRAVMPANPQNAESQRARWELGRYPLIRRHAFALLTAAVRNRSFAAFDSFLDLITPPLANVFAFSCAMLTLNALAVLIRVPGTFLFALLWAATLVFGVVHVLVGLHASPAGGEFRKALVHAPRYVLWKVRLYAKVLVHGHTKAWIRTAREGPGGGLHA